MSWIVLVTFSIRIWIKSKNRPCKSTTIDKSRAIGKISSHNVTVKTIIQDKLIAMTRNLTIVVRTHSSLLYYKSMRSIKNIYTRTDILRFIHSSVTVLTGARRSKSTEIWNFSFFFTVRWNRFLNGLMWQRGIGFITYIREKPGKFFYTNYTVLLTRDLTAGMMKRSILDSLLGTKNWKYYEKKTFLRPRPPRNSLQNESDVCRIHRQLKSTSNFK